MKGDLTMSAETTNTPSGASNMMSYLMNKNIEREGKVVATIDMAEQDPARELTGVEAGDNTVVETSKIIDINPEIDRLIDASAQEIAQLLKAGYVSISITPVGQPMIDSPEAKNQIKISIEQIKNAMKAKGALNYNDYIKLKEEKAREDREEPEEEEQDKNKNGIDDRNEPN